MGSTCSGIRRIRIRPGEVEHVAPPPYEPGRRTIVSSDQLHKDDAPELSAHPALRDQLVLSHESTTSQSRITPPHLSASTFVSSDVPIPPQAHIGSRPPAANNNLAPVLVVVSSIPDDETSITAATTPLWRWKNSQCQAWIAAVLSEYSGKSTEVAKELAAGFKGWGPNLYMKEWKQWNSWLGQDGQAIFALLMEVHGQEGAVPVTVEIAHYAVEDRKRAEREKDSKTERLAKVREAQSRRSRRD
ncbi:uncharacterized protein LY89DRAFT_690711 [Mollisia scopiformis]|uniref:Uncharacterized protein n=1 Tax=Mollisia scopiformis TaxID=149040 RepID=A0A132B8D5_MOLSC|nr:uncharacterized protein LY89DRAFT_690711 [Mollisia scopiformis]KUJ08662.1 hypothetical protein LY89DRAFT_690711 [Mollisia scopiformis]